jgi:hypothetical protein
MKLHEELTNVRYGQSAARRSLEFYLSPMAILLLKSGLLKGVSIAIHLRTRDPGGTRWRPSLTIPAEAGDKAIKRVTEELQKGSLKIPDRVKMNPILFDRVAL